MGEREQNSRERIQKADAHKERPLIQKELSIRMIPNAFVCGSNLSRVANSDLLIRVSRQL